MSRTTIALREMLDGKEWAAHVDAAKQAVLTKIEQKQALVAFDVAEQYQRMHSTPVIFPVQWQTARQAY